MTRRLALGVAALIAVAAPVLAEVPASMEATQIPNYRRVRPDLAFGGQPSPETLGRLGALGFRTVINLRTESEGAAEEGEIVRGQGLEYVWVPVTPGSFTLKDVEVVERVLDDPDAGPILLHCASSNRVGAVWAAIQARDGHTVEEAESEGVATGLHSPSMWEAVLRVLRLSPEPVEAGANP
jgi:uncharacterized protein (TIGR01244 family)